MRSILLVAALVSLASTVRADDEAGLPRVSVTEFETPDEALSPAELATLTDTLRGAVKKELGARFTVQTRDAKVAPQFVVAGKARKYGARKVLSLEAYEVKAHRLLGSDQLKGSKAEELYDELDKKARGLVRTWFDPGPAPVTTAAPAPAPAPAPVAAPATAAAAEAEEADAPASAEELAAKGSDFAKAGDFTNAVPELEAALQLEPQKPLRCKVLRNLGVSYSMLQRKAEAIQSYRAYLACVPETPDRAKIEAAIAAMQ